MKPTEKTNSRKRSVLRRWAVVVAGGCAAYLVAAAFHPPLLSVPAKMLAGNGGTTHRLGVVHGKLDGLPLAYDAYAEIVEDGTDLRSHGLFLLLRSGTLGQLPFERLLLGRDMILLPGNVDSLKLPFGVLLMETASGVEITSPKAFDHPMLNVETEEGLRRYRFRDSGRTEFVLDVPAEFVR